MSTINESFINNIRRAGFHFVIICFLHSISLGVIHALDVSVNHASFQNRDKAYLEVYLHVFANSIHDPFAEGAGVKTLILLKQDKRVINFENYKLLFPGDSTKLTFVDLKRFGLDNGIYDLVIEMSDLADSTNTFYYKESINIHFVQESFSQSDLLLLASVQKGEPSHPLYKMGYLMEDVPYNFYHAGLSSLYFYNELYHSSVLPDQDYFYAYSIHEQYAGEKGKKIKEAYKRLEKQDLNLLVHEIKLDDLPSGNYHLQLEIKNREKDVISVRTKNFQRNNPIFDLTLAQSAEVNYDYSFVHNIPEEELNYDLKAIVPRLSEESSEGLYYVLSNGNQDSKRFYLYRFWNAVSPDNPEIAFNQYMAVAKAVDKSFFSGFGFGFETDRGRVFLKYGKPSDLIAVEEEPSAPPYEIWIYNSVPETEQTNVKFLFYNPSLGHNDYRLLHSTCRGEVNNPAWEVELYSKAPNERIGNTIDARTMQDNFNRNARRYFENN